MNRIIVPVDFSDASANALTYAVAMAQQFETGLTLVHAYLTPLHIDEMHRTILLESEMDIMHLKEQLMADMVGRVKNRSEVSITTVVAEGGIALLTEEVAKKHDADLIVMGMKGEGKSSSLFGSTTTRIMRQAKYPVLVIPEEAAFRRVKTITLACDFSSDLLSEDYTMVKKIAQATGAKIQVLNVRTETSDLTPEEVTGKMSIARVLEGLPHTFHSVKDDEVTEGIEDFLDDNRSDMLAMVARKHSLLERLFGTVHTRQMSYETEIPLLVLQKK